MWMVPKGSRGRTDGGLIVRRNSWHFRRILPRRLLFLGGKSNESSPLPPFGVPPHNAPKVSLFAVAVCVVLIRAHLPSCAFTSVTTRGLRKRCRKRLDCGTKEGERGAKMLISEKLQGRSVFTIVSQFLSGALEERRGSFCRVN